MGNGNHPAWPIIRLTVMLGFLTVILYLTAHKFDRTELQTIIGMFMAGAAAEGLPGFLKRMVGNNSSGRRSGGTTEITETSEV